jgi:hypothetical protein
MCRKLGGCGRNCIRRRRSGAESVCKDGIQRGEMRRSAHYRSTVSSQNRQTQLRSSSTTTLPLPFSLIPLPAATDLAFCCCCSPAPGLSVSSTPNVPRACQIVSRSVSWSRVLDSIPEREEAGVDLALRGRLLDWRGRDEADWSGLRMGFRASVGEGDSEGMSKK